VNQISWWGLAASSILVVVAVALSAYQRLGLERDIVWAGMRALVQLLVVGAALGLVIADDAPLAWSWLWVVAMVAFAAWTSNRRAPEVPGVGWLAAVAYSGAALVSLGVLLGFGVFDVSPRTVVPLSGMVVGNSMAATVLVGRRIIAELGEKRDEVEARLALGHPSREAARPYLRAAVRTALIPQIETTKATGIVFLPGAMVGLILAGAEPADAVRVQVAVMYLVLGSVTTTTAVVAIGLSRRLFTRDHRLVRTATPASPP
jgi:putative ABC transport system permease protein